jgi:hypothetical protein
LYKSNEIDNTDSEEDVDINNKIKRIRENEDRVYYDDDDEFNEELERLIMEDQQEQFIDKNEFFCDSEYQYTRGKNKAVLYKIQQEHYKQIINEDREENTNNNTFPKLFFLYHRRRSFPRKGIIKFKFKTYEEFNK